MVQVFFPSFTEHKYVVEEHQHAESQEGMQGVCHRSIKSSDPLARPYDITLNS